MNSVLRRVMDMKDSKGNFVIPQVSPKVMNGSVEEICRTLPEWLDGIFKCSIASLKPGIDLKYTGYTYLSPEEVYNKRFGSSSGKDSFDLSHSDTYHIRFNFTFNGKELPKNVGILHLPYGRPGNMMMISGTRYTVIPVLSDTIISPDSKQIFVRLFKDKLTFKHESTNMIYNGEKVECVLIWLELMKKAVKKGDWGNPLSCIALYLLGKYGFTETVNKYFRANVSDKMKRKFKISDVLLRAERDPSLEDKYNYFASTGNKPKNFKIPTDIDYNGTKVHVYIHKDVPYTPFIENFVAAMIYSLEIMPYELDDIIQHIENNEVVNEQRKWKYILGRIAYKGSFSRNKVTKDIVEHFNSVEYYIDENIRSILKLNAELKKNEFNNFFDLVYYILENYSKLTLSSKTYNSDITHRYIDLKYYLCYNIIYAFNSVILALNKRLDKVNENIKPISENEVKKMFQEDFTQGIIYTIVKGKNGNFNINATQYVGDNMYFKCTALLEDQSCGEGTQRPMTGNRFPEATKFIHGSDLYLGSILSLQKSKPSGRFRANIYLDYDIKTGMIHVKKDQMETIRRIDKLIASKHHARDMEEMEDTEEHEVDSVGAEIIKEL